MCNDRNSGRKKTEKKMERKDWVREKVDPALVRIDRSLNKDNRPAALLPCTRDRAGIGSWHAFRE